MTTHCAYSETLETGDNSGFKIYQPDDRPSIGFSVTSKENNEDPNYPYWGTCGADVRSLCWPDTVPSAPRILRTDADSVVIDINYGSNEGSAAVNYQGKTYNFAFNTLNKDYATRTYRFQLKGQFTIEQTNCANLQRNLPKYPSESSATQVFSVLTSDNNSHVKCSIRLASAPTASERSISASMAAANIQIALGIYDILPSGKHLFGLTINDRLDMRQYVGRGYFKLADIGPVHLQGYIDLKASLNFK
ncbi:hypothetical protein [Pseudomonas caspiana]|nr:hypothetical protein [Pseudomonas caspiana]